MTKGRKRWFIGTGDPFICKDFLGHLKKATGHSYGNARVLPKICQGKALVAVSIDPKIVSFLANEKNGRYRLGELKLYFNYDNGNAVEEFIVVKWRREDAELCQGNSE